MSYHRNSPSPQHSSPPPRYDFELGHSPTHNSDQENTNEQRRGDYQATSDSTQTMTSGSHRHGPSNDLPPPPQHSMLQHSNHGPRPSLNQCHQAQIREIGNDHMYHSALGAVNTIEDVENMLSRFRRGPLTVKPLIKTHALTQM